MNHSYAMAICIINHGDPIVKPVKPVICINQRSYDMGFDIVGYQPNTARCLRDCVSNQRDLRRTTGHRWREAPCSRRTRGHQSLTEIMFRALKSYIYIYIHINNIYIYIKHINNIYIYT